MNTNPPREETILEQALCFTSSEARQAYLQGACGDDEGLRARVESLIEAHNAAGNFLRDKARQSAPTVREELLAEEGPGTVIGRYKLLQKIGEGGMGVVYMAEQEEPVRRRVALKIIKLGMDTKQVVARFEAERQALAMMDHPNMARVLDGGATETGRPYFVMELVQGVPITEFCDKNKLPAQERLKLFIQVCQAIQSAHQKGVIHRDIKPSNVLVTLHHSEPMAKVIDFGVAKATNQKLTEKTLFTNYATMIGTPAYMSPEQAEMSSMDVDTRADVYALGVLLYELLTGTTPFPEKRLRSLGYGEMQRVILEEEPERPSTRLSTMADEQKTAVARSHGEDLSTLSNLLRGDLDWVVMKCLEKDRRRRYETASALANDLQRHLNNDPVTARPPSAGYRFQKLVRRNKLAFAAAGAIAATLVFGTLVSAWQAVRATRAGDEAKTNEQKARQAEFKEREQSQRANQEAERAKLAEAETHQQVLRLSVGNGVRLLDEGDSTGALLWFARSLSLVQGNTDQERMHRLRYASVLQQCPRLVHLLECEPLNYAVFSSDGRTILTTGDNGEARVWDAVTGQPITPWLRHPKRSGEPGDPSNRVWHGAFSPDGTRVVTSAMDHTARIWDARTGQSIGSPLAHSNWVNHAEFSPDGRYVVTAALDNWTYVWDATSGKPTTPPLNHEGGLRQASFSPDGKWVLTASYDGTARIWNAATGDPLRTLKHEWVVWSAVFSRDGQCIATGSGDQSARLWEASTGKPVGLPMKHAEDVFHVCFSPDGRQLLTAGRKQAHIWDVTWANWFIRSHMSLHPVNGQPSRCLVQMGDS